MKVKHNLSSLKGLGPLGTLNFTVKLSRNIFKDMIRQIMLGNFHQMFNIVLRRLFLGTK